MYKGLDREEVGESLDSSLLVTVDIGPFEKKQSPLDKSNS
jgi:hypothetical protein